MAPEVYMAYNNEKQIYALSNQDIFSLGIIAHEIFSNGKHPFQHGDQLMENIKNGEYKIDYLNIPKSSMLEWIIKSRFYFYLK